MICAYTECNNEFTSNRKKKYCSRSCNDKQKAIRDAADKKHLKYYQKRKDVLKAKRDAEKQKRLENPDLKTCPTCKHEFHNTSVRPMVYCSEFCRRNSAVEKKKIKRRAELLTKKTCACRDCNKSFETIYTTKKYCSQSCLKREWNFSQGKAPRKPKEVKPKQEVKKAKTPAKKQYKTISKPEKGKRVVMALSDNVINCLEPKVKESDVIVQRAYTDKEAEMIAEFEATRISS